MCNIKKLNMHLSHSAIIILTSMLITSILLANFLNIFTISAFNVTSRTKNRQKIANSDKHLIWFLQVSDIHISIFQDPLRISEFREFCDLTVSTIKPKVVLASGDLTDAKTADGIGSRQFREEWEHYYNIIKDTKLTEKTLWLDLRGNHDNFNVASPKSKQNFFTNYSVQGRTHRRSYLYQIKNDKSNEIYSFIAVDACLEPGPRRPFNFIGLLDQEEMDVINNFIRKTETTGSNYTVWFGHFPTSCILSIANEGIRDTIKKDSNGLVYLCGHLHQLGGLVPKMYTLQKQGFLELELSDWKDNRMYRLLAIDHGFLSFIDLKHRQWPVALVTNPKHALIINKAKENLENIISSTHIRVLAFSISPIKLVKIRINGETWMDCDNVKKSPLYVTKWTPQKYLQGFHNIEVYVQDEDGREQFYQQPFQLDENRFLNFEILARVALMTDASVVFRIMFVVMLGLLVLPLVALRLLHTLVDKGKRQRPTLRKGCFKLWLRKLWILTSVDRIFWPIVLYPVYLSFGPWSIGYLIEDHLGIIFAWGIFVNGAFLPGSFTYVYGFIQLVTFQLPLTIILAHGVDMAFQHKVLTPERRKSVCSQITLHLPFLLVFSIQVVMAYLFWLAYGTMAFFLGPLRTWSLILAAILWYQALYLPEKCIEKATKIWHIQ